MQNPEKKTWKNLELTLISTNNIAGGGPNNYAHEATIRAHKQGGTIGGHPYYTFVYTPGVPVVGGFPHNVTSGAVNNYVS